MDSILNLFDELWRSLATPQAVDFGVRIKWIVATMGLFMLGGVWIGQFVLARSRTYFPKERFQLSLSWSLLLYALFLGALLGAGWWDGGKLSWAALTVHIPLILAALVAALLLTPSAPQTGAAS
jgi:hypothetical protein